MTGIEVLATEEVATGWSFNWFGFAVVFIATILTSIFVFAPKSKTVKELLQAAGILGGIAGLLVGFIVGRGAAIPVGYETHYKVTISDEVPLNDFLERYEIVDQEGRIYTIRELEGKDRD